jgi:hypothetical protein
VSGKAGVCAAPPLPPKSRAMSELDVTVDCRLILDRTHVQCFIGSYSSSGGASKSVMWRARA